jgi:hypothetical protein
MNSEILTVVFFENFVLLGKNAAEIGHGVVSVVNAVGRYDIKEP